MALTELLFTADGKISRDEFWKGVGFIMLVTLAASVLIVISDERTNPLPLISGCFLYFVAFWAWFTLVWKRCMTRGYSGWMFVFSFVPLVGWVWAFVALGVLGDDPKPHGKAV